MNPEDQVLTAARNAPEPPFPYDEDFTGKGSNLLKKEIERKKGLLKQQHASQDGKQFKRIIQSCQYHVSLNKALREFYESKLLSIRNDSSKWGDKPVQLAAIKLVKTLWNQFKLPMHISFFKLYNIWANNSIKDIEAKAAKEAAKAASKAGKSKRRIEEVDDAEVSNEEQISKSKRARPEKSPVKVKTTKKAPRAKTTSPPAKSPKSGPITKTAKKNEVHTKPKTKKAQAPKHAHPPRVGSDGISLRVGPCRLGHEDDQLAQGTIISLTPKMYDVDLSGEKISWPFDDGVLCRFTAPLKGKASSELIGSVFSVCSLHVVLFVDLLTILF